MSVSSGDTYVTDTDIPAQSAGTTVYYEVYALDNNSDETTSAEQSYTVACPSVSAPTATAATSASGTSFTANWNSVSGATGYHLDVYSSGGSMSDIIISEYIEGSSNNKYIEIFNGTGADVDLSDYDLELYANGATSPNNTENLSGTLADGSTLVFENSSAAIYSGSATSSSVCNFNGNDAIVLTKNGTDIDVIGTVGNSSTFAEDVTLIRKASVSTPNSTYDNGEWDSYSQDYEDLGTHAYSGGTSYHLQNEDVGNVTSYGVSGLTAGETYYYVVRAYNDCGSESGDSNEITVNLSCSDPTTQTSSLSFPDTQADQMDIAWTNGDGDYRLVVASTSAITGTPSDNTTYSADAVFNNGQDELNAGEFIVYAGSGSSVTMTGLNSDTEYFIKVFEYNCDGGSEQYLTISPLSGSETTVSNIPAVTDFDVTCMTETTATVEWTNPSSGDWDGVAIAVRRGTNPPQVLSGFAVPSALTVNTAFGNAGSQYGTGDDYSYAIYKGTGTSLTVTGLTQGEDYVFKAFSYYNDGYDNTSAVTTTSITNLNIDDVNNASATAGNTSATIQWNLPDLCCDEILVVTHAGSSVISNPIEDGSSYTANTLFGSGTDIGSNEFVVYKGTGTNVLIEGLTNGTEYYVKIFVRKGNEWSPGIEVSVVPADITIFNPGELIIIGFDASVDDNSIDKLYLTSLVDIHPGTEFLYVNSRFEAGAPAGVRTNQWHGGGDDPSLDPGIVSITYNGGSSISAGSIIAFKIHLNSPYDFELNGVSTSDFSATNNGTVTNISISAGDQLWLLQGVFSDQGTYHTLDGNVLFGMTTVENWVNLADPCDGSNSSAQRESRLHPDIECFNLSLSSSQGYAFYKNGTSGSPGSPIHNGSYRDILLDVFNPNNWISDYGTSSLDITEDFCACDLSNTENAIGRNFCITPYNIDHQWIGDNDADWFNCANWNSLHIPNENNDVLFDSDECFNNIELTTEDTARCNDLTMQGSGTYSFWAEGNNDKVIKIFGDLTIGVSDALVFDDFDDGTDDGIIILLGNWINTVGADGFWEGNSTVKFTGSENQTITTSADSEVFSSLLIDKSAGNINLTHDIEASTLDLSEGLITTGANQVFVNNTAETAITNHTAASYINGNLRRAITGAGSYDFPVGDASNFEVATVDVASATDLTYLDAHFASADLGDINIGGLGLQVDGTPLVSVLDAGYWQIEPNTGASVNYDIEVNLAGASNAAADAEQHAVIKRDDAASDWELQGSHDNATQSIAAGVVTAKVSELSAFSQFAIARSNQWVLAVELIDFSVKCETAGLSVNWTTASEDNADYFMIEYSSDTKNWETVQKLPAFGTTHIMQEYQVLLEDSPRKGYYRLAEVDMDGTITHYAPDFVNCLDADEQAMITVSPNPATDFAQLSALKTTSNLYLVAIYDAAGKLVNMLTWENPAEQALKLDLYGFAPGYYQLKIYNEREFYNKKLLVK
jgi:hypothetical protein